MQYYRYLGKAVDKVRQTSYQLAHDLNFTEARDNFFPDDAQLQFRQTVANAAVNAKAEGQVMTRVFPVDQKFVGL